MAEKLGIKEFDGGEIVSSAGFSYGFQPAVINANFDGAREKVLSLIEPYQGLTADVVATMNVKEAKKCRTDLNKIKKELDDARISFHKIYEQPYDVFKAQVDELVSMIKEPLALLDSAVKQAEELAKNQRREVLESTYNDFCPVLVPVVPFDRILEKSWLNASHGESKAIDELCAKAAQIKKDWDALKDTELSCPAETEAEFFRTLSLSDALAFDKAHFEELERINSLKQETTPPPSCETSPRTVNYDKTIHTFTIEVSLCEFQTTIDEATALKNHLALLNIPARMTIRNSEVCHA